MQNAKQKRPACELTPIRDKTLSPAPFTSKYHPTGSSFGLVEARRLPFLIDRGRFEVQQMCRICPGYSTGTVSSLNLIVLADG
jgi:hypothetical protein